MAKSSQVDHALDLFGDELARKKNVVGLGKVPSAQGEDSGDWDLAVYVEKKVPEADLAAKDLVPKTIELPVQGRPCVQTQVIEQGAVSLEVIE